MFWDPKPVLRGGLDIRQISHLHRTCRITVGNTNTPVPSAEVQQFIVELDEPHNKLKENISQAQHRYQKYADQHRLPPPTLRVGNHVYIKAKYFRTTQPSRKLAKKNLGPFEIIGTPGTLSFTLRLPDQFRSVHPVFHVSQLEPADSMKTG